MINPQFNIEYSAEGYDAESAFDDYPATQLSLVPLSSGVRSWRYQYVKRAIDLMCATAMMIICLVPCVLIALAIRFTTKGPIFYRETRIGRNGRPFRIWKFRSMSVKHPHNTHNLGPEGLRHQETLARWRTVKDTPDPRITRIGFFLRRWSLDEIPQLLNVLRGEMSLVGPRPVVKAEIPLYKHLDGFYLAAIPGLSGLWQVSGRSDINFTMRAQLDASYVQYWSLTKDLNILVKTLPAVLRRVGAR